MAHTSPLTGSRLPDLADAPNGPSAFSNSTLDLEDNCIVRGTTASDRDAKFTAWTAAGNTLTSGLTAFTQNDGRYWRYDTASSSWLYAGGNPPPVVAVSYFGGWSGLSGDPIGVFKDASGLVKIVGAVVNGSSYNPQDGGTPTRHTMFTLPTGYRPGGALFPLIVSGTGTAPVVTVKIGTDGVVEAVGGTASTVPSTFAHYFDAVPAFHTTMNAVPFA